MKKHLYNFLIVFSLSSSAVFAGHHNYASFLSYTSEVEHKATLDLSPWFDDFEQTLRTQPHYHKFVSAIAESFKQNENVLCTFTVERDGIARNLSVLENSSSKAVDRELISLIQTIHFSNIPNNLPSERGVEIEFWKADGKVYMWSRLNRATCNEKISLVDYVENSTSKTLGAWNNSKRFRNGSDAELAL